MKHRFAEHGIVMSTTEFKKALDRYLPAIAQARAERWHHDFRRQLFTECLRAGFDVKTEEMLLEEHVTGLRVRGFIDLLYQYLIFEFKRDIDAERDDAMRELRAYNSTG